MLRISQVNSSRLVSVDAINARALDSGATPFVRRNTYRSRAVSDNGLIPLAYSCVHVAVTFFAAFREADHADATSAGPKGIVASVIDLCRSHCGGGRNLGHTYTTTLPILDHSQRDLFASERGWFAWPGSSASWCGL